MEDHPILAHVMLGHAPVVDRQRAVVGTRLTVFPERPDAAPDVPALLAALAPAFPPPESGLPRGVRPFDPAAVKARAGKPQPLLLNAAGEALLEALMRAAPPHVLLEVPAFVAADPARLPLLQALHDAGTPLMVKGRPADELPKAVLPLFAHCIVDIEEARGALAPAAAGGISTVQSGIRTQAELDAAFQRGAVAAIGWPLEDAVAKPAGRATVPTDVQAVMELIAAVEREEPVGRLEPIVKKDPTIAFRLLRYLNSPAFGLSVEITSFGHALMMLGHQRLKRWLALLLAGSAKDANAKPVMHAAVRRGLLMEELGRHAGDAETRGEMFICGVFSLLDQLLRQPLADLLKSLPVPRGVQQALIEGAGPYQPQLELVRALESGSVFDIRERTEQVFLTPAEVNRALLAALTAARALD